jgi:hypothetical protein
MINWLTNSGLNITITVNPLHWQWIPKVYKDNLQEWPECYYLAYRASWLFLRAKLWIDDGSW